MYRLGRLRGNGGDILHIFGKGLNAAREAEKGGGGRFAI